MASEISEKGASPSIKASNKNASNVLTSEYSLPGEKNVHYVNRNETLFFTEYEDDIIPGYDSNLMRARAMLSSADEKKLLRRIDWHLIPLLAIMYLLKSVDFTNVSYARIMDKGTSHNILTEQKMTSDQYNLVTTMYYIPYIPEAPSNLLLKGVRPSVWQARIMVRFAFHCLKIFFLADDCRQGLYVVRFFLGLFEAGLWPGMLVQLCYWYRPDKIPPRIVLVTILGNLSTVISGVLAFAFNGVVASGLSGWKWLILTEGIFTILLGAFAYFFLPDFPSTSSWLSNKEQAFIQARLPSNSPRAAEANFDLKELITTLKNKRIWLFLLCWACFIVGTTGLSFYQPAVIANLGFTSMGETQLLNIPSAVFAVILTVAFGIFADSGRIPQSAIPLAFMMVIETCYGVLYAFPNNGGVYAASVIAGGFSTACIAMGFVGMAIIMNLITWGFTWKADVDTRKLKKIRLAAAKLNQAVLDDVDIHAGEKMET
ncbi:pantothenate transporter [Penicillium argentinense]|uniref:Pantothenate transporter n=1 Tax=Penicillium argentinense TaxID=1131581 RepID=A0A9W9F7M5_9EURO|nr:pantothenate transporter [Penicillium argentinense]KAJ5095120.1 pantothenate transporter [Penicillium argentinense]